MPASPHRWLGTAALAALLLTLPPATPAEAAGDGFISVDTVVVGCVAGAAAGALTILLPGAAAVAEGAAFAVAPAAVAGIAGIGCAVGVVSGLAAIGTALALDAGRKALGTETKP